MATFELQQTAVVNSTEYKEMGATPVNFSAVKVSDGKSGLVFSVGDTVTVDWQSSPGTLGTAFQAEYIGTVNVAGKDYMVLKDSVGFGGSGTLYYVIGIKPSDAPSSIVESGASKNITSESFTVCFFPGTLIATPSGEIMVEELVSGDLVLVGDSRVVQVKWIGQQTVSTKFGPAERLMPVRFDTGSLGGGGGATPNAA